MGKQQVIDYVMRTPYNTNPAVLKSLLNGLSEGGASEITFNDCEFIDYDVYITTSETLSDESYSIISLRSPEDDLIEGVVLPTDESTWYAILDGLLYEILETETGYSFVYINPVGRVSPNDFSDAMHDKVVALGGNDAEHEMVDIYWDQATSDGETVTPQTIIEANYLMWSIYHPESTVS